VQQFPRLFSTCYAPASLFSYTTSIYVLRVARWVSDSNLPVRWDADSTGVIALDGRRKSATVSLRNAVAKLSRALICSGAMRGWRLRATLQALRAGVLVRSRRVGAALFAVARLRRAYRAAAKRLRRLPRSIAAAPLLLLIALARGDAFCKRS